MPSPRLRPPAITTERRSHYYVDLARTQVRAGRAEAAIESLNFARQVAPQHVRHHADVKTTLAVLLAKATRPTQSLLEMSRWVGVLREIN